MKKKINWFLWTFWFLFTLLFFPSYDSELPYYHKFFGIHYECCYTVLPVVLIYGTIPPLVVDKGWEDWRNNRRSGSEMSYTSEYIMNPYWRYWIYTVAIFLVATFYLKRNMLWKLHQVTKPNA